MRHWGFTNIALEKHIWKWTGPKDKTEYRDVFIYSIDSKWKTNIDRRHSKNKETADDRAIALKQGEELQSWIIEGTRSKGNSSTGQSAKIIVYYAVVASK